MSTGSLVLPPLREDLQLLGGPVAADGSPTWTIHDPVRGRYFRIGWSMFQLLSRWRLGSAEALIEDVHATTTCRVDDEDVRSLIGFLLANQLTTEPPGGGTQGYVAQYRASRQGWLGWLIHHYLFVRIPIWRPQRFLRRTLPYVQWLYRPWVAWALAGIAGSGLYLVSEQWQTFRATFLHFFSLEGALLYAMTLCGAKWCHELGHAYTATRYGCRVPTMGIALLVLLPVPYTDVTDAWRLRSRRHRLHIGAAGMMVELAIAACSTLAWSFLPDGPWRSACFLLATVTWLQTIVINCSPFMRFDGYFLLADWLGIDNLQTRAFSLARWWLRRLLFALDEPSPESLPRPLVRRMIVYALCTWLYRLVVFTGIALLVYHVAFKLLGIVLFAIEIYWFIAMPIVRELVHWWRLRNRVLKTRRTWVVIACAVAAFAALCIPWTTSVQVPALLDARERAQIFSPEAAQIAEVRLRPGQAVKAGEVLVRLDVPSLRDEMARAESRLAFARLRAERASVVSSELPEMHVALRQYASESARLTGLRRRLDGLTLRAPFDGVVRDMEDALAPGRWIDRRQPLATVVGTAGAVIRGLADGADIARFERGASATFVPDDLTRRCVAAEVADIGLTVPQQSDLPYLASVHGGPIAARRDADGQLEAIAELYPVTFRVAIEEAPSQVIRGIARVDARPRSMLGRAYESVASVLIRESGF